VKELVSIRRADNGWVVVCFSDPNAAFDREILCLTWAEVMDAVMRRCFDVPVKAGTGDGPDPAWSPRR
jgi:hypothetical protein